MRDAVPVRDCTPHPIMAHNGICRIRRLIPPAFPPNIYALAAIGSKIFVAAYGMGVYASSDSGSTWTNANCGGLYIFSLCVRNSALYVASGDKGVLRSDDTGAHWTSLDSSGVGNGIGLVAGNSSYLFGIVFNRGIYRFVESSGHWQDISGTVPKNNLYCLCATNSLLVAGTQDSGIFVSNDNGSNWTAANSGLPQDSLSVRRLSANGDTLFAALNNGAIYKSTNSGASWTIVGAAFCFRDQILSIAFAGATILAGTAEQGIYRYVNGAWEQSNSGFYGRSVLSLLGDSGQLLAGASPGGLFALPDGGAWSQMYAQGFSLYNVMNLCSSDSGIFAASWSGCYFSANHGATWNITLKQMGMVEAVAAQGSLLFGGVYGSGIFKSTNGGVNWVEADSGLTDKAVFALACNSPVVYAGTSTGVFRSLNNGATWTSSPGLSNFIYALAISSCGVFAGMYDGPHFSSDSGLNWISSTNGIPSGSARNVRAFYVYGSNVFTGTDGGVFLTSDCGRSWYDVSEGLTNRVIGTIAIHGNTLYVGNLGAGSQVWKRPLSEMVESSSIKPSANSMPSAIPKTFSFTISSRTGFIRYTLPKTEQVFLRLYNVKGQMQSELVNMQQGAGYYTVNIQKGTSAAGSYLVVFKAGEYYLKKMIFLMR